MHKRNPREKENKGGNEEDTFQEIMAKVSHILWKNIHFQIQECQ